MNRCKAIPTIFAVTAFCGVALSAQTPAPRLELDRKGETIVLEPYAPNILRVTLSLQHEPAVAKPGYGFVAHRPLPAGPNLKPHTTMSTSRRASLPRSNANIRPGLRPCKRMVDIVEVL